MKKWDFWDSWMWETATNVEVYLFLSSDCPDEHTCSMLQCCATQGNTHLNSMSEQDSVMHHSSIYPCCLWKGVWVSGQEEKDSVNQKAASTRQLGDQYCRAYCWVCLPCNSNMTALFGTMEINVFFQLLAIWEGFEPSVRKQNLSASH